jgi:hypothetical protein
MVTYPSTYGVFEEEIKTIIDCIHSHGGQVTHTPSHTLIFTHTHTITHTHIHTHTHHHTHSYSHTHTPSHTRIFTHTHRHTALTVTPYCTTGHMTPHTLGYSTAHLFLLPLPTPCFISSLVFPFSPFEYPFHIPSSTSACPSLHPSLHHLFPPPIFLPFLLPFSIFLPPLPPHPPSLLGVHGRCQHECSGCSHITRIHR